MTASIQQPAGVILSGGRARRMGGGDKGLLALAGQSLLARVITRLEPQVADLALNANGDPARFEAFGLPVVADSIAGFAGPLAGVLAGLDWAAERGYSHIVTAAVDTPFFPCDLVPRLLEAAQSGGCDIALAATVASEVGKPARHPTFGLWPVHLREDLRAALEEGIRKVVVWADRYGAATACFPVKPFDPFLNINAPEDIARTQALL